jgi:hypothetical protein
MHGDDVAVPFVLFVPLVVTVENHRDHAIETNDETIVRRIVDAGVKGLVQLRKVRKSGLCLARS